MSKRANRRWRWPARVLAGGASALDLWWVFRRLDVKALGATLETTRWGWYLVAQTMFGTGLLAAGIRWHLMLRLNHEAVVHGAASVRMVFISQFFNTLFGGPSGGDVPKTALYSRWFGVPASDVLAASVLDRLVSSVGGLVFAATAVILGARQGAFDFVRGWEWHLPGGWFWAVAAGVVGAATGVLAWGSRRPDSFVGRSMRSLRGSAGRLLRSRRRSGHALGCAVATAVAFNLAQVCCLQAVSAEPVEWSKVLWMYHLITAAAAMPVTFAGTGVREGASMMLLAQYGIPATTAVAAALLTLSVHLTWALAGAMLLAWEHRARRGASPAGDGRVISAVVPVWNEAENLAETIGRLRRVPELAEILVVDGGSTDGTPELAQRLGCRVLRAARGRGAQLRTGALAARGDVVWMVHADTWVEPDAGAAMLRCLRDPLVAGGGFWKRFADAPWFMRGSRFRCWLRLVWSGRVLGDQALFVRRAALEKVGGVPELPLMEEVELCRRLKAVGRLALAGAPVATSMRRFRRRGIVR
ncbi:MAG: TIGR04283 family arsenosugar biosynthesis glycosyltransferase, partial [Verrucomicrobiales bacterium]|nr:TIGR04283 family arsenosugar biosynthesis glycosyltransferase [Verrucomicrobiales bacterium]